MAGSPASLNLVIAWAIAILIMAGVAMLWFRSLGRKKAETEARRAAGIQDPPWWPPIDRMPKETQKEKGPICPRCGSRKTVRKNLEVWQRLLFGLIVQLMLKRPAHCYACGNEFRATGSGKH